LIWFVSGKEPPQHPQPSVPSQCTSSRRADGKYRLSLENAPPDALELSEQCPFMHPQRAPFISTTLHTFVNEHLPCPHSSLSAPDKTRHWWRSGSAERGAADQTSYTTPRRHTHTRARAHTHTHSHTSSLHAFSPHPHHSQQTARSRCRFTHI
jgi:hypothetical protein